MSNNMFEERTLPKYRHRGWLGLIRILAIPGAFVAGMRRTMRLVENPPFAELPDFDPQGKFALPPRRLAALRQASHYIDHALPAPGMRFVGEEVPSFLYFGRTVNNEREFVGFASLPGLSGKPPPYDAKRANLVWMQREQKTPTPSDRRLLVALRALAVGLLTGRRVTPRLVQHVALFSRYFAWAWIYCAHHRDTLPRLAVVANDHSAGPIAFSSVMKIWGVPRLYLQHGEVSERLPPLEFEYSVLRNSISLDIYRRIGPVSGEVFVVPRKVAEPRYAELLRSPPEPVEVVVYPSSVHRDAVLREMLHAIVANPAVAKCAVKPHPRSPVSGSDVIDGVEVIDSIPDRAHLALVGNSSITLELLARGVRAYILFALDSIDQDYYGFVANGVARSVELENLSDAFWRDWLPAQPMMTALARYDPLIDDEWRADAAHLGQCLARYFEGN
jgi:hypothetical protein